MRARLRIGLLGDTLFVMAAGAVVALAISLSARPAARAADKGQSAGDRRGSGIETVDVRLNGDAAWLGDLRATVSIVEFADFFCPYCAKHAGSVLTALREGPVRAGRVRYAFRQTPLTAIHPQAQAAGEAAVCAGEQGAFWKMHDLLFAQVRTAQQIDRLVLARSLNLDDGRYRSCLDGRGKAAVAIDANEAASLGVEGTPTFFVGRTMPDGSVRAYRRLRGARDDDAFQLAIQEVERGTSHDVPTDAARRRDGRAAADRDRSGPLRTATRPPVRDANRMPHSICRHHAGHRSLSGV